MLHAVVLSPAGVTGKERRLYNRAIATEFVRAVEAVTFGPALSGSAAPADSTLAVEPALPSDLCCHVG